MIVFAIGIFRNFRRIGVALLCVCEIIITKNISLSNFVTRNQIIPNENIIRKFTISDEKGKGTKHEI